MGGMAQLVLTLSTIMHFIIFDNTLASSLDISTILKEGDSSVKNCDLTQDCDPNRLPESSYDSYFRTDKQSWGSLGLDPNLLHINEISVGFVPAFREKKEPNTPQQINAKLYKPMSIVGDYISISSWDPNFKAIDWHIPTIQELEGTPVWCIALLPSEGLDSITYEVADKIAQKMKQVNDLGIPVWLRFAHEMNGNWYPWGMQPEKFKRKWEVIARKVKAVTNKTYMLWSPNAMFGDGVDAKRGGYTPYWPNPDTVDIVGISFYHWGKGYQRINIAPTTAEAIDKLQAFAKIYGPEGWGKPVVVAETAACFTYYQGTHQSIGGSASEVEIKMTWLHLLVDRYIKKVIPGLKAVIWFEVIKDENATGNTPVRTEDFRLVVGNPDVSYAVRKLFASYDSKEKTEHRS